MAPARRRRRGPAAGRPAGRRRRPGRRPGQRRPWSSASGAYPGTATLEEDADKHKARKEAGVTAQLFESYPIRYWDHYLGPRDRRLYRIPTAGGADDGRGRAATWCSTAPASTSTTRWPSTSLPTAPPSLTGWHTRAGATDLATNLVAVDTATGERRTLAAGDAAYWDVRCSPDGRSAVCVREILGDPDHAEHDDAVARRPRHRRGPRPHPRPRPLAPRPGVGARLVGRATSSPTRADGPRPSASTSPRARSPASRPPGPSPTCARPPTAPRVYALRNTVASPPEAVALDAARRRPGATADPRRPGLVPWSRCPAGSRS